jgi:hypothetical protein
MTLVKNLNPETALTLEQKVIAAYLHIVRGINQQDIAIALGGVNSGRVAEAISQIKALNGGE